MGLLDTISKVSDPADVFGTRSGAAAAETAKDLGYQSVALQREWLDYIRSQTEPFQESALRALPMQEALIGVSGPEAQAEAIANLESSPLFQSMIDQGEEAILQRASATGGLRGGNTQAALAQFRPQLLSQTIEQQLNRLGGLSGRGLQSQQLGQAGGAQALGELTGTMGQIGNIGVSQAAQQQNTAMGIAGLVASFFSDERLKTNINKIGEKNGLPLYEWEWNQTAKDKFGLEGKDAGHMATDVELKYPEAISVKDGYKQVNYGLIEELA